MRAREPRLFWEGESEEVEGLEIESRETREKVLEG